jgi:hypothetical protein
LIARPSLSIRLLMLPAFLLGAGILAAAATPVKPPTPEPGEEEPVAPQVDMEALATVPPPTQPLSIQSARMPEEPAAGMGRLRIDFAGTRKWCTFPDDRVVKPQAPQEGPPARNQVYTFGYKFTVAALNRAHPSETMLLFESPTIRTAVLRQAAKLGVAKPPPANRAPTIGEPPERVMVKGKKLDPTAMVPLWQEEYRCTTLPEAFDFDLAPGTYDLYLAFDILLRSGNWAHRTIAYETDVTIGEGDTTRLQATAGIRAGGLRELELGAASASTSGAP